MRAFGQTHNYRETEIGTFKEILIKFPFDYEVEKDLYLVFT